MAAWRRCRAKAGGHASTGFADLEFAAEHDPAAFAAGPAVEALEQQMRRLLAYGADRLRHRGELWPERIGPGKIVEARDGDVFRAAQLQMIERLHDADHHLIVRRKDGRRRVGRRHQPQRRIVGLVDAEIAQLHQRRLARNAVFLERFAIAGKALASGEGVQHARDEPDAPVPEADEIAQGAVHGGAVVDDDRVALEPIDKAVDQHDRQPRPLERGAEPRVVPGRRCVRPVLRLRATALRL